MASASAPECAGRTGEQIYMEMCANCHGKKGEGVAEKHDEPLYGDRSLPSLTRLIERTMPEEDPKLVVGEEARKVAEYIFNEFYSPAARAKISPPRIELARLTAKQYQNSVADLLGSFRGESKAGEETGLNAEYYNARNFKRDKRVWEKTDSRIQFNFGASSPDTNHFGVEEFAIKWRGALVADHSGDYEIRLRTENGARVFLNDERVALIDEWVSSGNEPREHVKSIRLMGGRAYPIQVDFFKFKEKSASITLEWRPPHGAWEIIPERNLRRGRANEVFVVETAFPADDASTGYERGAIISKEWDKAVTYAAIEVAAAVVEDLDRLSGSKKEDSDRVEKVRQFAGQFVERAFRQPLTPELRKFFVEDRFDGLEPEEAMKQIVLLTLKSPRFLYPDLPEGSPKGYQTAARLALGLWDSIPDARLLEKAAKDELKTESQVLAEAERMLQDPRAKGKLMEFFHHWLEMEEGEEASKDPDAYPDFTEKILADAQKSLELFIDEVVWSERSDYRELLLADYVYMNPRLAKFYGAEPMEGVAEDQFQKITFKGHQRSGVLTHPYLLTAFAYYKSSSPIHRGVFLTRNIVGRGLKPPPQAIQFMDGRFDPSMTMREKVTELTSPAACQGCHTIINPLGFSLENFDGVGRFRTEENGKQIDATGEYTSNDGETVKISGARDVAEFAARSEDGQRSFVRQMFQHIAKQPAQAYGPDTLEKLRVKFAQNDCHIRKLIVEIAALNALRPAPRVEQIAARTNQEVEP